MVSLNKKQYRKDNRKNILDTAARLFAEYGFSAAGMEKIAKEAKVPKSLIYYHFKSKRQILEVLIEGFFSDLKKLIENAGDMQGLETPENQFKMLYADFLKQRKNIVKIAFVQSLTDKTEEAPLMRLLDIFLELKSLHEPEKKHTAATTQTLMQYFYMNLIPTSAYICFSEKFTKTYGLSEAEYTDQFARLLATMHRQFKNVTEEKS